MRMGRKAGKYEESEPGKKKGNSNGPAQALMFFRGFLKHPGMVGWLMPSSRFVIDQVLKEVDWQSSKLIVEYGPGLGNFTSTILKRMRSDAKLLALEINPEFVSFLQNSFTDPRLKVLDKSAADIDAILAEHGFEQADCVISGIPFSTIPHELRESIVRKTHSILRPGGKFLVYQFSNTVLPYLEESFGHVDCGRELLNLLPTRLYFCRRRMEST
jgi:phospholipid N-methyltransferase